MTKAELYQKACMLPLLPGVYIIRDKSDTIIYIGKAKRLRIRVSQYFREGVPHDNKVSQMIAHAYAFDVIVCQSEFEALVLEASQIKAHTPKYNILLKDDKGYSYIRVTREEWPRLSFTLQKEEDGAEYIGPYTSSFAARQMAETAMDAFLLPRCSKRFPQEIGKGRPCLNAHIGKAKRLRIRVSQYFREGVPHDNKVSQMIAHAYAFDVIVCQSEFEALVLEASQIKAHTPKYNILL